MFVVVDGTLDFPVNGPKLRLPCNSGFVINSGGSLTASASGGGGSANFLEICNVVYWRKADGTQTGPIIYGAPLPVDLVFFDANVIEETVHLSWVTASEINNDYFTLEKSIDAKNWEVVTYSQGAGNSNQMINYLEVDYNPHKGISYYRLRQVDYDGTSTTSDMVSVFNPGTALDDELSIYPNPSLGNSVFLRIPELAVGDRGYIEVFDISGKARLRKDIEELNSIEELSHNGLPAGMYLVSLRSNSINHTRKRVIQ